MQQAADHDEGEHADDHQTDDHAEFLAGDGEDEVRMRVGQHVLDVALTGTAAPQPAIAERLQRLGRLIIGGCPRRARMQEFLHALLHVAEEHVSGEAGAADAKHAKPGEEQVEPGQEQLREEHHGDDAEHADVGL